MRLAILSLALLPGLLRPPATLAQASISDSTIVRLAWGAVNVLVRADTVDGVDVWAEASPIGYRGQQLRFVAYFAPAQRDSARSAELP